MKGKFSKEYDKQVLYGRLSTKAGQECHIIGETRDKICYKVLWPGSKTPSVYHKSFIEIIPEAIDSTTLKPHTNG